MPAPVPFRQFYRPHGRSAIVSIDMPNHIARLADIIRSKGYEFQCEVLTFGVVSFTVTDPDEGDMDIELVGNGPGVPAAVEQLIERFAKRMEFVDD